MSLFLLLLLLNNNSYSQNLSADWKGFDIQEWGLTVLEDESETGTYIGRVPDGKLIFLLNNKTVIYYAFNESKIDSKFNEDLHSHLFVQSCLAFYGDVGFDSFRLNKYIYYLKPCNNCNTDTVFGSKECIYLALKLKLFIKK